ncbi:unnamed protein product [Rotaria sp. Silwood2]|nr:unnamed protein product [Rotaria sp. Silwood2]CAF2795957.1 unnamed protein product [Rotaria sp. Silwood2]CAF3189858.1 unnamed protein product [Rotaria sp. Silwood2]CAF3919262.1 unnamed protein product [Rotaria sp. Silwood2]CAF4353269.1 unnamed protein product [Rotaria sp. Silwood2]
MQRIKRSETISNDEIGLQTQLRQSKLFQHHRGNPFHSAIPVSSPLYLACQNNDLALVESCLKKMKPEEIDFQYPPNNETALHVATRNQHKEIIRTLLFYGAQRSLRNAHDQQAYQLAETDEIKDLFKRQKSSRFAFLHSRCKTTTLSQSKIKCESCSLVNDNTFYEWELVDRNASQKALRFRHELKPSTSMKEKELKQRLYSIKKGYINARLQDVSAVDGARICNYFKRALLQQDPYYIITAYTICQNFSELLNKDMARNVIHDLKNGCSKFSCDCLYSTEDGTKSITNILLHHPKFQKVSFKGEVYRGIVVPKNTLDHYKVGSYIITTTFLSTSKDPAVAQAFCDKGSANPTMHSFFCIYEILNDNRSGLDISKISEFEDENEVLILPYSAFLITKIEEGPETTNIYLKEHCLKHMFGNDGSQEYSIQSIMRPVELVRSSLLNNISEIVLQEDDGIRLRSKTMPALETNF